MTTWTYKISPGGSVNSGLGVIRIELDRGGIEFFCNKFGAPSGNETLILTENNELQLLFFAQQLISIINETRPEWVLKNHLVVSAKAIRDFRSEEFSNES
jgi:hypothetical protein